MMLPENKKDREKILKDCIPEMIVEIINSIDIIISPKCLTQIELDGGERYSLVHFIEKEVNGKDYELAYKIQFSILEL